MATLGIVRRDSGTFAGATTGATVTGRGISYRLDGTFVATVVVEFQDTIFDDWIVSRSDSAAATGMPVNILDLVVRNWRVRCSAFTSGAPKYSVEGLDYVPVRTPGTNNASTAA